MQIFADNRLITKVFAACVCLVAASVPAYCEEATSISIEPARFGFEISNGELRSGNGRRVTTNDDDGNPVTATLHVEVGDHRIVLLPDGTLVARKSSEAAVTDRAFTPVTHDELLERLANEFPDFETKKSRRYVYVYNTSEGFATATQRIIESMYNGVVIHAKAQSIKVHDPQVPMIVIMFRTEGEYQKYQRMPAGMVAYYHILTNRVVMFEQASRPPPIPEMALRQSLSTIAHEGAHQILHNIGVQQRLSMWPMWLAEGYAEYMAPTSAAKDLRWKGAGQINDMRMFELEEYLKSRSNEALDGQTIEQTVRAQRLTSTGYASAWSLTHLLAKNRRYDLNAYINQVSRLGPLEGLADNVGSFKRAFGDDLAAIEKQLVVHLKKQPYKSPFADFPHYLVLVSYNDGRRLKREANMFPSRETALLWEREVLAAIPADQRGTAEHTIRQFPNRVAANRVLLQFTRNK